MSNSGSSLDVCVDLTKSEMQAVKNGMPTKLGLCSYFPKDEFLGRVREVIRAEDLPVDVKNIQLGAPAANKMAHY